MERGEGEAGREESQLAGMPFLTPAELTRLVEGRRKFWEVKGVCPSCVSFVSSVEFFPWLR